MDPDYIMNAPDSSASLASNVTRLSRLDLPGAGQVYVAGGFAYIGHIANREGLGTTIVDVANPGRPQVVSQISVGEAHSHSHKARVIGDIMIVNVEQNGTIGRKADELPGLRVRMCAELGREASRGELAARLGVKEADVLAVEEMERQPYDRGGFKIYDITNRAKPKLITYVRTHGRGVHRFDMDADYAYISTEMSGYTGNILVIYDIRNPARPEEVSRWWMPGQHIAGGEKPTWPGRQHRLHHTLRHGDRLWAGCWLGGVRIIDVSDIRKPHTIGQYNYHPPFTDPSHTFMRIPVSLGGREVAVAIDEEAHAHSAEEMAKRRGRPHACLWVFDVTNPGAITPISVWQLSELDSPWSRAAPGRFGAHQFQEHTKGGDTLVYCAWFAGGLRIVDIKDPTAPQEVGFFIPEPASGKAAPQTNDVDVDEKGLVYIVDRYSGFDILEFKRPD
jgi:hypothetical protein